MPQHRLSSHGETKLGGPFRLPAGLEVAALRIELHGTYHDENEAPFEVETLHQSGFAQALTSLCITTEHEGAESPWDEVELTDQILPRLEDLSICLISIRGRSTCSTTSHGPAEDTPMHAGRWWQLPARKPGP